MITDPQAPVRAALTAARNQFLDYERQHRAKGTPEAAAKADVNQRMAVMMDAALNTISTPQERPSGEEVAAMVERLHKAAFGPLHERSTVLLVTAGALLERLALQPAPPGVGLPYQQDFLARQYTIGLGLVDIGPINFGGRHGVLIRPRAHIPYGMPGELQNVEYWPQEADVVLWVEGEGPGVLIEKLSELLPDSVALATPGDAQASGEPDLRTCALLDQQFAYGVQAGYRLGLEGDENGYATLLKSRDGYLSVLKETRLSAHPQATPIGREELARIVQEGFLKRQTWHEIADAILSRITGERGAGAEDSRLGRAAPSACPPPAPEHGGEPAEVAG